MSSDATLSLVMEHCQGGSLFGVLAEMRRGQRSQRPACRSSQQPQQSGHEGIAGTDDQHSRPSNARRSSATGAVAALLDGPQLLRILQGTAEGMAFLHSRGIIHRDLKSANLLLDAGQSEVKVCDFGLSRQAFETAAMTRVGSVQWAAPEVLLGVAYGQRADVWSYGVVTWECLTGLIPFAGLSRTAVARGVAIEGLRLPIPTLDAERCPLDMLKLLASCFEKERARPEFGDVLRILDSCEGQISIGQDRASRRV